jgi:class 3 adenylate cyclase
VALAATATVPLAGLVLLLRRPSLDLVVEHHPGHFWLVLGAATLSAVVAYGTGVASTRRGDARLLLVSLAFLSSAGFLGLHALATPGVLLATPNAGFTLATPIGVALGSLFAAWSAVDVHEARGVRIVAAGTWLRAGLLAAMVLWAVASLAELPPLHLHSAPEKASGPMVAMSVVAIALYAWGAWRYLLLWRERRATMPLAVAGAFVLLAEALVALLFAPNWRLSWWEWHVLMLAAFTLVAAGAQRQWHEERFAEIYLDQTVAGRREMSILFADLRGFTTFSEAHEPAEVTAMLNAFFQVAIPPVVEAHGGDIDRLIGDAIMATFNRRGDQPDHAQRAAAAALDLQRATGEVAADHPGWPRFRAAVNTGEVLVTVLGAGGGRTHTVIGDAVNVASRLEARAPVGGVAVSASTLTQLSGARVEPLGALDLKGKAEPVDAYVLLDLDDT